jgi:hypothetical protein
MAHTQTTTDQLTQGSLAGLDQYIAAQKDAISKGLINPDQANRALQARIAGTDVYTASKAAADLGVSNANAQITQRGQETGLAQQKIGTLGSMFNAGLSEFGALNKDVTPGSNAAGLGFIGYQRGAQAMANQYQAPPRVEPTPMPPMLQPFAGGGQPAAGAVTINIGGAPQATAQPQPAPQPTLQGNASGVGGNGTGVSNTPFQAQGASALNPYRLATTADVPNIMKMAGIG